MKVSRKSDSLSEPDRGNPPPTFDAAQVVYLATTLINDWYPEMDPEAYIGDVENRLEKVASAILRGRVLFFVQTIASAVPGLRVSLLEHPETPQVIRDKLKDVPR